MVHSEKKRKKSLKKVCLFKYLLIDTTPCYYWKTQGILTWGFSVKITLYSWNHSMWPFGFCIFCKVAAECNSLTSLMFKPFGKTIDSTVSFYQEALHVWLSLFVMLGALDTQYLNQFIHWGLQNGDSLLLLFHFHLLNGVYIERYFSSPTIWLPADMIHTWITGEKFVPLCTSFQNGFKKNWFPIILLKQSGGF